MAVAADYAGWVQELDRYEAGVGEDDDDDPRVESTSRRALQSRGTTVGIGTGRKVKPRAPSVSEELQQEMKLLNWHKLANEAALKAAIIKTNKIKSDDSRFASSLANEDVEEKRQRIQQIIEEEQLRPLHVTTEFFRDFEAREQRDEIKVENDVQRHIQHLKKLKETMAQREDLHRRRHKYKEGMAELGHGAKSQSIPKGPKSNQDDELSSSTSKRYHRSLSTAQKADAATADVICSLDKLMELERRIRHLEDAGLGVDCLNEDVPGESGMVLENIDGDNVTSTKNIRFSKRKSSGPSHEPSRAVYAVKTVAKARAKDDRSSVTQSTVSGAARKRSLAPSKPKPPATFVTSLPESKSRQLRRMTDRERRNFAKQEKALEVREQKLKQDVVIQDWMHKKKQAAQQRKATTQHANPQAAKQPPTASTRRVAGKPLPLPPPPRVKAPLRGAASGKHIANPHLQKFDDVRKGFEKRKEAMHKMPTNGNGVNKVLALRPTPHDKQRAKKATGSQALPTASRSSSTATKPPSVSRFPTGPTSLQHRPVGDTTRLPAISRAAPLLPSLPTTQRPGVLGPLPGGMGMGRQASLGGNSGSTLPRINGGYCMPSPPPAASKNPGMPQFSRLHKR